MARRFRRSAGRRSNWVSRQEHLWTAVLADNISVPAATVQSLVVVARADWSTGRSGLQHATLARVRGQVVVEANAVALSQVFAYLIRIDEDEALPTPRSVTNLAQEDILWTGVGTVQALTNDRQAMNWEIDVKARRKLTNQDTIAFLYASAIATTCSGILRGLVVVK